MPDLGSGPHTFVTATAGDSAPQIPARLGAGSGQELEEMGRPRLPLSRPGQQGSGLAPERGGGEPGAGPAEVTKLPAPQVGPAAAPGRRPHLG